MITLSVAQGSAHFYVQESFSYILTHCTNQLCGVVIWTGRKGDSTFSTSMCLLTWVELENPAHVGGAGESGPRAPSGSNGWGLGTGPDMMIAAIVDNFYST